MSPGESSGNRSLEDVRAIVGERLRAQRPEIERAVLACIRAVPDPAGDIDGEYLAGLRATITAVVDYGFAGIELGVGRSGPIPPVAVAQAHHAARSGVGKDTVLRRYIAGHALFDDFVMQAAEEEGLLGYGAALRCIRRTQVSLLDRLIVSIVEEYSREARRARYSPQQRLGELVRKLLAGEHVDHADLGGYRLEGWHLGLIAVGSSAEQALQTLVARVGRPLLSVPDGDEAVWAWFAGQSRLAVGDIEGVVTSREWPVEVSLAVGEPAREIDGWRLTHQQAQEALRTLRRPARITCYADVALLALVLQNDLAERSLREIYLAPLGARSGQGAIARRTLRPYFKAGGNAATVANELGVTAKTVRRRLREIEQRLGRPLPTCHAEMEIALRLEDLDAA